MSVRYQWRVTGWQPGHVRLMDEKVMGTSDEIVRRIYRLARLHGDHDPTIELASCSRHHSWWTERNGTGFNATLIKGGPRDFRQPAARKPVRPYPPKPASSTGKALTEVAHPRSRRDFSELLGEARDILEFLSARRLVGNDPNPCEHPDRKRLRAWVARLASRVRRDG